MSKATKTTTLDLIDELTAKLSQAESLMMFISGHYTDNGNAFSLNPETVVNGFWLVSDLIAQSKQVARSLGGKND